MEIDRHIFPIDLIQEIWVLFFEIEPKLIEEFLVSIETYPFLAGDFIKSRKRFLDLIKIYIRKIGFGQRRLVGGFLPLLQSFIILFLTFLISHTARIYAIKF